MNDAGSSMSTSTRTPAGGPVTVYLDSQDFSNFCPSSAAFSRVVRVRDELLELKLSGMARFVFSDTHIFEAMPTDPTFARGGMERMRTIASWCGGNNLPSSIGLMEFELKQMLGMPATLPTDWFPDFDFPAPSRQVIKKAARELDSPYLNRATRRVLEKKISLGQIRMTQREAAESAREFAAKYPFLGNDAAAVQRYFARTGPWSRVRDLVEAGLRDIAGFATWLVDNWEHGQKFASILRGSGASFFGAMEKVREDARAAVRRALQTISKSEAADALAEGLEAARSNLLITTPATLARKMLDVGEVSDEVRFSMETTPSILVMWHFMFDLMKRSTALSGPRKPLPSDFADANHILFAGHVDVFRTDQFAADALRRLKMTPTTTIVSDLGDLAETIRRVAASRSAGS